MFLFSQPAWKHISLSKQETRTKRIDAAVGGLRKQSVGDGETSAEDEKYLRATATEIVQSISEGKWLAEDVAAAYVRRAARVQQLHNPITEVLFSEALEQAKALDKEFARTGKIKGPLHGVPVSIKDQFEVEGVDTTVGFSAWCNSPAERDANAVQAIKRAGGIVICKTNVPQTLLNFECSNPVWGVTTNPWNALYTCGGSSGGEGAMLAADASALGLGSDIGGSLRIPALYCGIYSLKPGAGRVSRQGARSLNPGFDAIKMTAGPMGRSVGDVKRLSQVLFSSISANTYEGLAPVPFRDVELPTRLKIGYYFEDGWVRTSPANRRAVQETVEALKGAGHELVEFELPYGPKSIQLFAGLTSGDGYRTLQSPCGDDPIEKNLFLITLGPKLFGWVRNSAAWIIETVIGDRLFGQTLRRSKHSTVAEYWQNSKEMGEMNKEFYESVWEKYEFDAIVAPGMCCPALPHGATRRLSPLANGTFYYNVIDSPVGAIPVTRVDPEKDCLPDDWSAKGKQVGSSILGTGLYGPGGIYNVEKMKGLPVGIQVVGRHWEDEKVLAIMDVIDKALPPRNFGPGSWTPPNESTKK